MHSIRVNAQFFYFIAMFSKCDRKSEKDELKSDFFHFFWEICCLDGYKRVGGLINEST